MRELYLYWKTAKPEEALTAVRAAQRQLCKEMPGLQAQLLVREEAAARNPLATLMEIYRHRAGIDAAMQAQIDAAMALATMDLRTGERHTEVFVSA
jgi:hypothetical protein